MPLCWHINKCAIKQVLEQDITVAGWLTIFFLIIKIEFNGMVVTSASVKRFI